MIKSSLAPPVVTQEVIDHYIAEARRERARVIRAFFRGLFQRRERLAEPGAGLSAAAASAA